MAEFEAGLPRFERATRAASQVLGPRPRLVGWLRTVSTAGKQTRGAHPKKQAKKHVEKSSEERATRAASHKTKTARKPHGTVWNEHSD